MTVFANNPALNPGPSWDVVPITFDDNNNLATALSGLRSIDAGTVVVFTAGSGALPTPLARTLNFTAGETRYVAIVRILSSGSIAANKLEGLV